MRVTCVLQVIPVHVKLTCDAHKSATLWIWRVLLCHRCVILLPWATFKGVCVLHLVRLSRSRKTSVTFRFWHPESSKKRFWVWLFSQAYCLFLWPLVYELVTCLWIHVWTSNVPWNIWEALTFQQTVLVPKDGGDVVSLSQHVKHILEVFLCIFPCESSLLLTGVFHLLRDEYTIFWLRKHMKRDIFLRPTKPFLQ